MRALALVLLLAACGGKKEKSEPAPVKETPKPDVTVTVDAAAAAAPAGDCADRVARLDKRLTELAAATPGFMPIVDGINAPESAAGKPFDARGFVVAVAKDGTSSVQGAKFKTPKELGQWLDAMNKSALEKFIMGGGQGKDAKFPVYYWADRDTPASTLAEVLAIAEANGMHWVPRLVVAGKGTPALANLSPEVTAIAAKLPKNEPESTDYVAGQLRSAIGQCEPIITPMGTASIEGTPDKISAKIVKDVPAGFAKCDCKIPNPDVFEWAMNVWLGSGAPALAWVDMPKLAKGEKQPIGKLVK